MNCAIPRAPAPLTENGLKFDSAYSWAARSAAPTLQRWAARVIAGTKRTGTNDGRVERRSPTAAPKPTEREPGFSV